MEEPIQLLLLESGISISNRPTEKIQHLLIGKVDVAFSIKRRSCWHLNVIDLVRFSDIDNFLVNCPASGTKLFCNSVSPKETPLGKLHSRCPKAYDVEKLPPPSSTNPIGGFAAIRLVEATQKLGEIHHEENLMDVMLEDELLVDQTEPTDDEEPQSIRYDIASYPTDFTVEVMYEKWQSGQLVIPEFQRGFVWRQTQASRLIESFLLGLPIPQVFLYRERTNPKLIVVDGHQRLATIAHYYNGCLPGKQKFRLRGVNSTWEGKAYDELTEIDQLNLKRCNIESNSYSANHSQ